MRDGEVAAQKRVSCVNPCSETGGKVGRLCSGSAVCSTLAASKCGLQRIPPLSTTLCPHLIQRYAPTAYNVMPPTGRLGSVLSVIHAERRVRVRIIHAGGMPAFSSSGAEDANLFTEVLLKSARKSAR